MSSWEGMSSILTGIEGLVSSIGIVIRLVSSMSEITKSLTILLCVRWCSRSMVVKAIFIGSPNTPSFLQSLSVQNVLLLPLSRNAYVMTDFFVVSDHTLTGTMAIEILLFLVLMKHVRAVGGG